MCMYLHACTHYAASVHVLEHKICVHVTIQCNTLNAVILCYVLVYMLLVSVLIMYQLHVHVHVRIRHYPNKCNMGKI